MQELIKRLHNNDPEIITVNLTNQKIDVSLCMGLCLALAKNTHVRYLDLSNNPLGKDGWLIVSRMLLKNKHITTLKLRNTYKEEFNRYGRNSSDAPSKLLDALLNSSVNIEELDLIDNEPSWDSTVKELISLLTKKPYFRRLYLDNVLRAEDVKNIYRDFATALAKNIQLEVISLRGLSFSSLGKQESLTLVRSLLDHNNISIDLSICNIDAQMMLDMLNLLKETKSHNIQLNLSSNRFGESVEFGFEFALALAEITCLQSLNLNHTALSKVNSLALQHGLTQNKSLRELSLTGNCLDDTTLKAIQSQLQKRLRDDFIVLLLILNQLVNNHQLNPDLWLHIIDYLDVSELNKTPEEKQACAKLILEENHITLKTRLTQLAIDSPLVKEKAGVSKKLFYFFDHEKPDLSSAEDSNQTDNQGLTL